MFLLAKEMRQIDNNSFKITWVDGVSSLFNLAHLQRNCPCAVCLEGQVNVVEDVKAFRIVSVGSHALRIDFSSGCSKGIYTFPFLRKLSLGDE